MVDKTCRTCEFNFDGICAGEGLYQYGVKIVDSNIECDGWGISLNYFSEVIDNLPWYIKKPYQRGKLYFGEVLNKLQEDESVKGTLINIYEAIENVYGIPWWELGEILGVKSTVVGRAVCKGTVEKRKVQFATTLCIPEEYFDEFYSKQLDELKICKEKFYFLHGDKWVMKMRKQAQKSLKQ